MDKGSQYPRFAFFEFLIVVTGCVVLSLRPELGWLPLIIALIPWAIRIIILQIPFRVSILALLIPVFLIPSTIGFLIAYDPVTAIHKLYLIVGAILLFFSLAHQPKENTPIIAVSLGLLGAFTTILFLLITDWATFPADLGFINTIGNWITKYLSPSFIQKAFSPQLISANMVGGITAILIPIVLASSIFFWQKKQQLHTILSFFILVLLFFGLTFSSSRAAWVAVFISLSFASILGYSLQKYSIGISQFTYPAIALFIILLGVLLPFLFATDLSETPIFISEITSLDSRLKLARQTYFLIADFPFTGGGLGAFPGLYSQYILVIPYFMFGYSHNLYLDLVLELGISGFLVWVSIILASAFTLGSSLRRFSNNKPLWLFGVATFSSLITWLLHGILDDPVYGGSWGLIFLFVIPGIALAISNQHKGFNFQVIKHFWGLGLLGLSGFVIVLLLFINPISSSWHANIGAISMAKTELADFPSGEWASANQDGNFIQPTRYFTKSLLQNPKEVTAHYRLGLIMMSGYDFQKAAEHLEMALAVSPAHRGIQKNLGYCYTWLGEFDKANLLLKQIPEAKSEMETYTWWWQTQGQNHLAANAFEMFERLD